MTRSGATSFRLGHVIEQTLRIFCARFPVWFVLALVVYLPVIAYHGYVLHASGSSMGHAMGTLARYRWVWAFLAPTILAGFVIAGVFRALEGRATKLGYCLRRGGARLPHVLVTGLLVWGYLILLVGVPVSLIAIYLLGHVPIAGGWFIHAPTAAALVVALLVIAILAARWWVFVPVCVAEGWVGRQAIRRSAQLTKGHRWLIVALLGFLFLLATGFSFVTAAARGSASVDARVWVWSDLAIEMLFAILYAVGTAVGYHALRGAREGATATELDRVFA